MTNDESLTNASQIGLNWSVDFDGGAAIIDYKLQYKAENAAEFTVLEESLTGNSYVTSIILQTNQNYVFKIQAQNSVGYSLESAELLVLVARVPDVPTAFLTTRDGDNVLVTWTP